MSLIRIVWGGHIYDSDTAGTAIEEWSCSMSVLGPQSPDLASRIADLGVVMKNFHQQTGTGIHARAAIEWLKLNEVDPVTGIQITDPTIMTTWTSANRGAITGSPYVPIITSMRVSLDNGTRDRRAKGGFFLPVFSRTLGANGRFSTVVKTDLITAFQAVNSHIEGWGPAYQVGVWSRVNGSVITATRVRVGDVPDFQSRRKNDLKESYSFGNL